MPPTHNVGFRVFTQIQRPLAAVVAGPGKGETTYVTDTMNRFGGMDANVRPVDPAMRLAGPAVAVRVPPGDYLMDYKAMEIAQPCDIIVIEARGFTSVAQRGDLVSMIGRRLELGGMVTDGSLRDLAGIRAVRFPVFAADWLVPNGARRNGPGEVNVPVAVGGVPVLPGDVVLGDANGVVVVLRDDTAAVLEAARAVAEYEKVRLRESVEGQLIPSWLESSLREKGCEIL